jgi:hypothetical protein
MYTIHDIDKMAEKYGPYASWAVWNPKAQKETSIIRNAVADLKSSVIIVGLNISQPLSDSWSNFRGGKHDRKLMYAFNNSPYRGAYMTDLLKGIVQAKSQEILSKIKRGEIDVREHVQSFREEMDTIGATSNSLFILFGKAVHSIFSEHLSSNYPNSVFCEHYSSTKWTDAKWLDQTWGKLEKHAQGKKSNYNTLPFRRTDEMRSALRALRRSR